MSIEKLAARCKCGVYLTTNSHRDVYETAASILSDDPAIDPKGYLPEELSDIEPGVLRKMIETDTIVDLQFYPDSPVGFYRVLHYDVGLAIAKALHILGMQP